MQIIVDPSIMKLNPTTDASRVEKATYEQVKKVLLQGVNDWALWGRRVKESCKFRIIALDAGTEYSAAAFPSEGVIRYNTNAHQVTGWYLPRLFLYSRHEIGHMLGLPHFTGCPDKHECHVMAYGDFYGSISPREASIVRSVYGVGARCIHPVVDQYLSDMRRVKTKLDRTDEFIDVYLDELDKLRKKYTHIDPSPQERLEYRRKVHVLNKRIGRRQELMDTYDALLYEDVPKEVLYIANSFAPIHRKVLDGQKLVASEFESLAADEVQFYEAYYTEFEE